MSAGPDKPLPFRARMVAGVRARAASLVAAARSRPRIAIAIGAAALLFLLVGPPIFYWLAAKREAMVIKTSLEQGLTALQEGRLDDARVIAVELRALHNLQPKDRGGPAYLLGAAMSITADSAPNPDEERNLHEIAARYLHEAEDIGFPAGFEAEGAYRLGVSLFKIDRFAEAIPRLQLALLEKHPERVKLHHLLATAFFLDSQPNLKAALESNQALLKEKGLTDEQLESALLQQAEIAFRLDDDAIFQDAMAQMADGEKQTPIAVAAKILQARKLLRDAATAGKAPAQALRKQAGELLREVLAGQNVRRQQQAEATFFLGKIESIEHKYDPALAQFNRARRLASGSSLVAAITLEEGDVHLARSNNPDRAAEAVACFRRVLKPIDPSLPFVNPWITRDEVTTRVVAAVEKLLDENQYASALDLNVALALATDSAETLRLTGEIETAWGRSLQDEISLKGGVDSDRSKLAREHLRKAARAHEALAERRVATRDFTSYMQEAAKLYEEGRDYESARKVLTRMLDVQGRVDRPETLVMLGKILLDLDRLEEALSVLNECFLSFRRNPVSYRARMLASLALAEQGKLDDAKNLLQVNLWEEDLSPQSADWRDSLFALADLLFTQARVAESKAKDLAALKSSAKGEITDAFDAAAKLYEAAAERLNEAVSRYPESEKAVLARYLLAECNRSLARRRMQLRESSPVQTSQAQLDREEKAYLAAALADLGVVQTQLNQRADVRELNLTERKMLRNCYFLSADCLFDQHKYEEAIAAYADAAGRYQTEPAAIEAFAQIAASYRRLRRPADEHTALLQAQGMLARLPADADFSATTRTSRADWAEYLAWRAAAR